MVKDIKIEYLYLDRFKNIVYATSVDIKRDRVFYVNVKHTRHISDVYTLALKCWNPIDKGYVE